MADNTINGQISSNISSIYSNLQYLNFSRNNIQGSIPCDLSQTNLLDKWDLSDNQLSGKVPELVVRQLVEVKDLTYLNPCQNNFIGRVPSFANSPVAFMHWNNNHLSGLFKSMCNGNSLVMIDLSYNEISNFKIWYRTLVIKGWVFSF